MNKTLVRKVVERCAEALVTNDVLPLHRAQEAIERHVLVHRERGDAGREVEHGRLRETEPLQKLVRNTARSILGR
jgi:hypothetical protein